MKSLETTDTLFAETSMASVSTQLLRYRPITTSSNLPYWF